MATYLDKNKIELVKVRPLSPQRHIVRCHLDCFADNEVPDALPLRFRECFPSGRNKMLEDLEANELQ